VPILADVRGGGGNRAKGPEPGFLSILLLRLQVQSQGHERLEVLVISLIMTALHSCSNLHNLQDNLHIHGHDRLAPEITFMVMPGFCSGSNLRTMTGFRS
jgi:hypothetical protein